MLKQLNEESFKILSFKYLNVSQIKSLGLSKNKAKSIKSLVLFFSQNPNSKNLYRMSEEERYDNLIKIFEMLEDEANSLTEKKISLPAYDQCLKASHIFNLLDARGVIGAAQRTEYISRIRELAKGSGTSWLESQK